MWIWQAVATLFCLASTVALWPVTAVEELMGMQERKVEKVDSGQPGVSPEVNGLLDAERKGIVSG